MEIPFRKELKLRIKKEDWQIRIIIASSLS